jgi:hypothetical protein
MDRPYRTPSLVVTSCETMDMATAHVGHTIDCLMQVFSWKEKNQYT